MKFERLLMTESSESDIQKYLTDVLEKEVKGYRLVYDHTATELGRPRIYFKVLKKVGSPGKYELMCLEKDGNNVWVIPRENAGIGFRTAEAMSLKFEDAIASDKERALSLF